jgi:hypothetical protein
MADEERVVTDEELDNALLGGNEQEVVEEVQEKTEEVQEELEEAKEELEKEEDQAEKTRLGRKVKQLQDSFSELNSKLDLLLQQGAGRQEANQAETENDDEEFEMPLTKAELKKLLPEFLAKQQAEETSKKTSYEKAYIAQVLNVLGKDLDDKAHDEVSKIMIEKYNVKITGTPEIDAELNWLKAERDYMALGKKTRKVAVRGEKPPEHVADDKGEHVDAVDVMTKLDPKAREYAESIGMKPEDIKKALGLK